VALELKRRGHQPLMATCEVYRAKVEGEGIDFAPMRPDVGELRNRSDLFKRAFHPLRGSEYIIRDLMVPPIAESYADLSRCALDADLLITHSVTYAAPLLAEARGVRWLSVALQPGVLFSLYDPPRLPQTKWARRLPVAWRRIPFGVARAYTRRWFKPYYDLRRSLGLPETDRHPMIEGQFSPYGTLGLFSRVLAQPQPDWPPKMTVTGFAFHDRFDAASHALSAEVEKFLEAGPPPLVFTLGSSAIFGAGDFWEVSAEATRRLGRRAVFLVGPEFVNASRAWPDIFISGYEPHSLLFPRAAAIIHQGGIGTTGQALRSGIPQLVVSFSHDQPDNGARVVEAGSGTTLRRHRYSQRRAVQLLETMLTDRALQVTAAEAGERVRGERGLADSSNVIEQLLSGS
jgi:rhamnosyltransferase subunit B